MTSLDTRTTLDVRADVADLLDIPADELTDERDLISLGLHSLGIMGLVARWTRAGAPVRFGDLARRPTLGAWRDLVAAAEADPGTETGSTPGAGVEPDDDTFALGTMQHAYWLGRSDTQTLGGVAAHGYLEFAVTDPDLDRLQASLARLVRRHPSLRTSVDPTGRQKVEEDSPSSTLVVHDLRDRPVDEAAAAIVATRERMSTQVLDASRGHLLDVEVSLPPAGPTTLHVDVDIIAADAVSFRTLLRELAVAYDDPGIEFAPIGYRYREYLADKERSTALRRRADERWWRSRLSDLPDPPSLPARPGGPAPDVTRTTVRREFLLDATATREFGEVARRAGLTPPSLHATLAAVVVGRWSGSSRLLLNVPLFNRRPLHADVDAMVGDFSSSLAVTVDLGDGTTPDSTDLAALARSVQDSIYEAASHADFEGLDVFRALGRARGEHVVAPVVFTSGVGLGDLVGPEVLRVFGMPVAGVTQGPQIHLDVQVMDIDGGTLVSWDSRDGLMPDEMVTNMFAEQRRLYDLVTRPDVDPADVSRADLLAGGGVPAAPAAAPVDRRSAATRIHETFFARAAREPDRTCLAVEGGAEWTYGRVAAAALAGGGALAARGIGRGDRVALALEKGPAQVVGALAVLAAGATYVPLGTDQPPARRALVLREAAPALLVVDDEPADQPTGADDPATDAAPPTVRLEDLLGSPAAPLTAPVPGAPEDAVYVLFTSGSTGVPKGVVVSHRAVRNTLDACAKILDLRPDDRTVAVSSLEFDLSAQDLFGALDVGASVAVPAGDIRRDGIRLARLVAEANVTHLYCVPGVLRLLLDGLDGTPVAAVRVVICGGDRIGRDLVADAGRLLPAARFFGLGGATETAIHHSFHEVTADAPRDWTAVPFGKALPGNRLRVVDALGADAPDWAEGELWIGGIGLADGYLGRPEETAARFVHHDDTRWWRSGDIVRRRPDGVVEFVGRRDSQVKIRGFRVDLGDIEAAVHALDGVADAAAADLQAGGRTEIGVIVDPAIDPARLRTLLAGAVPEHMLPSVVIGGAVPRTSEGKTDIRALRARLAEERARQRSATGPVAPADPLEAALVAVFDLVLAELRSPADAGVVDVTAGFFDIGGDSVAVTRIVTEIRRVLMFERVGVIDLLECGSIRELAGRIRELYEHADVVDLIAETYLETAGTTVREACL